ncbi:MAG: 3'(2'),5'-bisphosphate nucleotidase CysQ [Bacteroidetes bacterium]|nr:3'(2'),5'-bisphosphate nucleotidase CysQ [Bacteroidota bacterium]
MSSNLSLAEDSLFTILFEAAHKAGKAILDVYSRDDFGEKIKDDNSPLTEADKNANTEIMNVLASTQLPVLSEEGKSIPYEERSGWKEFWMVDPLDGTKEFIKRNGEFTVNIALIRNNTPVIGIVYAPATDTCWIGDVSNGAFVCHTFSASIDSGVKPEFKPMKSNSDFRPYTVVGSRSHSSKETEDFVAELQKKYGEINFLSAGSSLKICKVAEGFANIYPRLAPTMEWDTAAGHAVAVAAGCRVDEFISNTPLKYNKENLLNPWFVVEALPA